MTHRPIVLPILAAALCAAAPPPIDTLRAAIAERGARAAVAQLVATHRWDAVLGRIDTGRQDWVMLAPSLALGTDGARSEELTIALATGLPVNPAAVLSVLDQADGPVLGITRVCGAPFVADIDVAAYRTRAVRAVHATDDTPTRAACLAALTTHG